MLANINSSLEKYLLEKAATNKRLEYLSLSSELEKQTDITKKQYHLLTRFIDLIKRVMK